MERNRKRHQREAAEDGLLFGRQSFPAEAGLHI